MSLTHLTQSQRVVVQRAAAAPDGALGWSESWTDVAALQCRIQPTGGQERERFGQLGPECTHLIYFSQEPPLSGRTRIVWGRRLFVEPRLKNVDEQNRLWVAAVRELPAS